jgi:hypothetical protein
LASRASADAIASTTPSAPPGVPSLDTPSTPPGVPSLNTPSTTPGVPSLSEPSLSSWGGQSRGLWLSVTTPSGAQLVPPMPSVTWYDPNVLSRLPDFDPNGISSWYTYQPEGAPWPIMLPMAPDWIPVPSVNNAAPYFVPPGQAGLQRPPGLDYVLAWMRQQGFTNSQLNAYVPKSPGIAYVPKPPAP